MEIHSPTAAELDAALEAARGLQAALAAVLATNRCDIEALLVAAEEACDANRLEHARDLLERALAQRPPPEARGRAQQLYSWLDAIEGRPLHAHERLLTEAARLEGTHVAIAADLHADAAVAAAVGGDPEAARTAARRACDVAAGAGPSAAVDLRAGTALLLAGDGLEGERLIRRALKNARSGELSRGAFRLDVTALYWTEEYGVAAAVLDRLIEHGRRSQDRLLAGWLDTRAVIDFRLGRWSAAEARASEARRLADSRGQTMQSASCLTTLARIAAARGRAEDCRRWLDRAAAVAATGKDLQFGWLRSAAGLLELGLGHVDDAIEALEPLVESGVGQAANDPSVGLATADLIEAYVRGGRVPDAVRLCEKFEARAATSGRAWAAAALHRCRGLLAATGTVDEEFQEALRQHRRTPTPFELARTELCYGERLRRARKRRDARTHLRSALGSFVQLGAAPWAERARRELAAMQRRSDSGDAPHARLTSHELRVAALVERGLRNREIAGALFVSERTVEYHLTNIYAKLDVRSRTELSRLLGSTSDRETR